VNLSESKACISSLVNSLFCVWLMMSLRALVVADTSWAGLVGGACVGPGTGCGDCAIFPNKDWLGAVDWDPWLPNIDPTFGPRLDCRNRDDLAASLSPNRETFPTGDGGWVAAWNKELEVFDCDLPSRASGLDNCVNKIIILLTYYIFNDNNLSLEGAMNLIFCTI